MKIAIILSGHLRSYQNTFSSFQKLKNKLSSFGQIDVFAHTWDIEESVSSWWKEKEAGIAPQPNVNETEVRELYQPRAMLIEASKHFQEPVLPIKTLIPVPGILSMLYSQYAAYQLMEKHCKETGITYDIVLKTRYDLEYEIDDSFVEKIKGIKRGELLVPNTNSFELTGACADIFAIGDYHSVCECLKFYERFDSMLDAYLQHQYLELVPELCLRTYLDKFNIQYTELEGLRLTILRTNGVNFTVNSDRHFADNTPNSFTRQVIDRCEKIFSGNRETFTERKKQVILKYLHWIDPNATTDELKDYNDFYNGKWISLKKLNKLTSKFRSSRVLSEKIKRDFFEEAMLASQYGPGRKFLFAAILQKTGFGLYFFKTIWKKR